MGREFYPLDFIAKDGREFPAISDATFTVAPGELACLVGPSGCGKTTLLKILAGLQSYDSGEAQIGSPSHPFDPARDIGMVFQQPLLLKWRRLLQNVLLPAEILGLPMRESARTRARAHRDGRAHRLRGQIPVRAVRGHAAARRHSARPRA